MGNYVPRELTADEEAAFLDAAEQGGWRYRALFLTAIGTGGHLSELVRLTWDRIDLPARTVTFTGTRAARCRCVPIDPQLVAVLAKMYKLTSMESGPFTFWRISEADKAFKRAARLAGFLDIKPDDLRRSYILRLFRSGTSIENVKRLAGFNPENKSTVYLYRRAVQGGGA